MPTQKAVHGITVAHFYETYREKLQMDLVTGEADLKFTELARRMGERIPRARLSVVEGAGHAVHLERSGDLATLMGF